MAKKVAAILTIPLAYGNVTVGDETISLSISAERKTLALGVADKQLVGKRLIGRLTCQASARPDQPSLTGADAVEEVEGAFDVSSIGVTRKKIKFTVAFARQSVDITTITDYAMRSGELIVAEIEDIPQKPRGRPKKDDEEGEDE